MSKYALTQTYVTFKTGTLPSYQRALFCHEGDWVWPLTSPDPTILLHKRLIIDLKYDECRKASRQNSDSQFEQVSSSALSSKETGMRAKRRYLEPNWHYWAEKRAAVWAEQHSKETIFCKSSLKTYSREEWSQFLGLKTQWSCSVQEQRPELWRRGRQHKYFPD